MPEADQPKKYTSDAQVRQYLTSSCPWLDRVARSHVLEFVAWVLKQPDEDLWRMNHFDETKRLVFQHDKFAVSFDETGSCTLAIKDLYAGAARNIIEWLNKG